MEAKIRAYVESLFRNTPPSQQAVELKEELIQNLIEKYKDLIANGKSPEAAYNVAIASIGDISELLAGLGGHPIENTVPSASPGEIEQQKRRSAIMTAVAVCLYILCAVPVIIFQNEFGVVLLFLMIAAATGLLIINSSLNKKVVSAPDTVVGDFQQWRRVNDSRHQIYSVISTILTVLTICFYFLISFVTHAWYITWLVFVISAVIRKMIKVIIFEVFG